MSKDNNANLKARDEAYSKLQKRRANDRAFITFMSAMICLFMLFIPTCQQAKKQGVTYEQR